jgi:hypothetical protein
VWLYVCSLKASSPQPLEHPADRIRRVHVILAQYRPRFGLEILDGVLQVDETVRFDFDDLLECIRCDHDVVCGPVVRGERIMVGSEPFEHLVVCVGRVLFRSSEHHVLEEMGEAAQSLFHFIPRSGADNRVVCDNARAVERYRDDR